MKRLCLAMMLIVLASCQAALDSETDETADSQSQTTSCVALGQQQGYPYDMLQCHKRGAVTNADGCDRSWTGDKAWVCEVYKRQQPPNDEWRLLNVGGPTKTPAGATECDLCLGYTQGGNAELKGFWHFTQPARIIEVLAGALSMSIRECSILQATRTSRGLNPTTLYCESLARPAVVVQGNPKILRDAQTQQDYIVGQNVLSQNGRIVASKRYFNPSSVLIDQRGHSLDFSRNDYPLEIGIEVGQTWQPLARYTAGGLGSLTECFSADESNCPPDLFRSTEYDAFYGEDAPVGAYPFRFTVNGFAQEVLSFVAPMHRQGPQGEFMRCQAQITTQSYTMCAKVILP